jgi:tetratricopeptide (TPR) repeat protein
VSPRDLILLPHTGEAPLDQQIIALQKRIADATEATPLIERLGLLFIAKARTSGDPGYYKLAEQCATVVLTEHPGAADALLLRGHALGAMHRFRDAEAVARQLVKQRENFLDYALLGDALMEQGRLDEAVEAYQTMIDLRPGLQSYCRVAHLRWLKGDLAGAMELMSQAVQTGSSRDPEPVAWAYARLALYQLEDGSHSEAMRSADRAYGIGAGIWRGAARPRPYPARARKASRGSPASQARRCAHPAARVPLGARRCIPRGR